MHGEKFEWISLQTDIIACSYHLFFSYHNQFEYHRKSDLYMLPVYSNTQSEAEHVCVYILTYICRVNLEQECRPFAHIQFPDASSPRLLQKGLGTR